jgi:hypothetical protein
VHGSPRESRLRRTARLLPVCLIGLAGILTLCAGQALAAPSGSPEVKLDVAKQVTKTTATIEVAINPEGSQTTFEIWLECQSAERLSNACEPNGDSLASARRALARHHCRLGKATTPHAHREALVVASQSVRSGRKLASEAKVSVTLRPARH